MNNNKTKVGIYCRVGHADKYSINKQEKLLKLYLESKGISNYKVYKDNGFSGNDDNRTGLKELLHDVERGKIDTIYTLDLSRIWRDSFKMSNFLDRLSVKMLRFFLLKKILITKKTRIYIRCF